MSSHPLLSLDLSYASFESIQLTVEELGVPTNTNEIEDLLRKVNLVLEDDEEHAIEALLKQVNDVINDGEDNDSINTTQTTISKVGYSAPTMSFVHNQHTNELSSIISRTVDENSFYHSPLNQTCREEERRRSITKYHDSKIISRNTSPDIQNKSHTNSKSSNPAIMKTFNLPKIEYNTLISEVDQTIETAADPIFEKYLRKEKKDNYSNGLPDTRDMSLATLEYLRRHNLCAEDEACTKILDIEKIRSMPKLR